jgi:hypothetical protein
MPSKKRWRERSGDGPNMTFSANVSNEKNER